MDTWHAASTVVTPDDTPQLYLDPDQDDASTPSARWTLLLDGDSVAVELDGDQARAIVDDYLSQIVSAPFEFGEIPDEATFVAAARTVRPTRPGERRGGRDRGARVPRVDGARARSRAGRAHLSGQLRDVAAPHAVRLTPQPAEPSPDAGRLSWDDAVRHAADKATVPCRATDRQAVAHLGSAARRPSSHRLARLNRPVEIGGAAPTSRWEALRTRDTTAK